MDMHERYKRPIRIIGKPDNFLGWHVEVQDVKTGEAIGNVLSVHIILDPGELNVAELTYYQTHGNGKFLLGEDGNPIISKQRLHDLEVDIIAWEVRSLERERLERIKDALLLWGNINCGRGIEEKCMPRLHRLIGELEALARG